MQITKIAENIVKRNKNSEMPENARNCTNMLGNCSGSKYGETPKKLLKFF